MVGGLGFILVCIAALRVESKRRMWVSSLFANHLLLVVGSSHQFNDLLDGPCAVSEEVSTDDVCMSRLPFDASSRVGNQLGLDGGLIVEPLPHSFVTPFIP